MSSIGVVQEIWRYPVKSMRGEQLESVFVAFAGLMGDRVYGLINDEANPGFPWHTAREQEPLLLYTPKFTSAADTTRPVNLSAAETEGPGINPIYPDDSAFAVQVRTPDGDNYEIQDPALLEHLHSQTGAKLRIHYSQRGQMDCRPVSLLSAQTVRTLSGELDMEVDRRRFRANIFVDWHDQGGYHEDSLVGRTVQIGERLEMQILERDPRCKMITLDPDTAEISPRVLKHVSRKHEGYTGVYAAVLKEGAIAEGDEVKVL